MLGLMSGKVDWPSGIPGVLNLAAAKMDVRGGALSYNKNSLQPISFDKLFQRVQ